MKSRLIDKSAALILAAAMIAPYLGLFSAQRPESGGRRAAGGFALSYPRQLFADLDGDAALDEAKLSSTRQYKNIRVRLSDSRTSSFSFATDTSDPGRLICGDIDHDNDQDLVWYSQTDPDQIFFWLNDGRGDFGLATRYRLIDQRTDIDLNSLLARETPSLTTDHRQSGEPPRALPSDDSMTAGTESQREAPPRANPAVSLNLWPTPSIHLKSIFKRGPPALLS